MDFLARPQAEEVPASRPLWRLLVAFGRGGLATQRGLVNSLDLGLDQLVRR
jgi:hypothetical protein